MKSRVPEVCANKDYISLLNSSRVLGQAEHTDSLFAKVRGNAVASGPRAQSPARKPADRIFLGTFGGGGGWRPHEVDRVACRPTLRRLASIATRQHPEAGTPPKCPSESEHLVRSTLTPELSKGPLRRLFSLSPLTLIVWVSPHAHKIWPRVKANLTHVLAWKVAAQTTEQVGSRVPRS